MDIVGWILISILFLLGYLSFIYPVLPGILFVIAGLFLYGFWFSFAPFGIVYWVLQASIVALIFLADWAATYFGVKKWGGSKAAINGSLIGMLIGPFVIPAVGLFVGPFAGAVIGELIVHRGPFLKALKIGVGSLLGFIAGSLAKFVLQTIMIVLLFVWIFI
ncbi:DUF456 domain-containing protein [Aureibacillus halotolerans]|uniref:DUF456 family protein n=1 Tax=Aureibacillus halotolerans TaxID=1508390 RepID=A0A4V3D5X3_9BACI|nr:DUF456 family protein [Aureibacillus halotolerans]TDQ41707.1 hypothetical protein EV213_103293 [Aureibacillus halotolerans]